MKIGLSLAGQFDYDPAQPLDFRQGDIEAREGVTIHDVSYAGVASGRVEAFLVAPAGARKMPGVIFVHPAPGSRYTFLDEALQLAHHGAASLLIDAPWSRGEAWGLAMGEPEHDRQAYIQTTKNLRRAIDLLATLPEVDAGRIAYVGHSLGALFGGILAGVEERIETYVLVAGVGSFTDVAALNLPQLRGSALEHYREILAPMDPLAYVPYAAPSLLLFQFGLQDRSYARGKFIEFAAAGSEPKAVKWYNSDHYLPDPCARRDRFEWLRMHLPLGQRFQPPIKTSEGRSR